MNLFCADPSCKHTFEVDKSLAYKRVCCDVCGAEGSAIPARIRRKLLAETTSDPLPDLPADAFVVIVEDLRSIHNVGSIMRSCDAFAVDLVVMCGISATPNNPKFARTALGAELSVPWVWRPDGPSAINELRRYPLEIVALEHSESAISPERARLQKPVALVIGNEVAGISSPVLDLSDRHIEIPMRGIKSSFNAAVAFGIVAWELCRNA